MASSFSLREQRHTCECQRQQIVGAQIGRRARRAGQKQSLQLPGIAVFTIAKRGDYGRDGRNGESQLDHFTGAIADKPAHVHENTGLKRHRRAGSIAQHFALQWQRLGDVVMPALWTADGDADREQYNRRHRSPQENPPAPGRDQRKRKQHAKLRLHREQPDQHAGNDRSPVERRRRSQAGPRS